MPLIEVKNVSKSFNGFKLKNISFEVENEIFGLLGPNGAGKTTTIRILVGLIKPDSGEINVLGKNPRDVIDQIGYLPEERGLYRKLKVKEVLEYLASLKGKADVDFWLDRFGLRNLADEKVENLSKGLQQKLQIIAAIQHNPKVLVLDEPFSGLDPVNVEFLKNLLLELKRDKAIVISTHMLNIAERICDRVLLINRGRAVLYGRLNDIKSEEVVEVEYVENGEIKKMITNKSLRELLEDGYEIRKYVKREISLEEIFLREVMK